MVCRCKPVPRYQLGPKGIEGLLYSVGHKLWSAVLVGKPCPKVADLCERMNNPQIGDVVMEITTIPIRSVVGVLVKLPDRYRDGWVVQRLNSGAEERWSNANFVAIDWPRE